MTRFRTALFAAASLTTLFLPSCAAPESNTVGYTFTKRYLDGEETSSLGGRRLERRQSGTVQVGLDNGLMLYLINVTVGTPPQPFALQLDTGSSDVWFPAVSANICQQDPSSCVFGTYSIDDSSSGRVYEDLPEFDIEYVDGSQVSGTFISDVLNFGTVQLTNMTMAAATKLNTAGIGIMGLGFDSDESSAQQSNFTYPNIVSVLQNEGFINRRAYSLWLDDIQSATGSILFGGVDTSKYHGDLVAVPIQPDSRTNQILSFSIAWTGLTVSGSGNNIDLSPRQPIAAILDSGSTTMLLPDNIANDLINGVGASIDRTYGPVVACALGNDNLTLSFEFGGAPGAMVNVSISQLVAPIIQPDGSSATLSDGSQACTFGVQAAQGNPVILGDTFLRSAYVVYDLENQVIGLAQTNFDAQSDDSNVQAFQAGSGGIPEATRTATVAAQQTATGVPRVTGDAGGTGTVQATGASATFQLSATGGGGASASTSTSSSVAAGYVRPVGVKGQNALGFGFVVVGLVFGGGLMVV